MLWRLKTQALIPIKLITLCFMAGTLPPYEQRKKHPCQSAPHETEATVCMFIAVFTCTWLHVSTYACMWIIKGLLWPSLWLLSHVCVSLDPLCNLSPLSSYNVSFSLTPPSTAPSPLVVCWHAKLIQRTFHFMPDSSTMAALHERAVHQCVRQERRFPEQHIKWDTEQMGQVQESERERETYVHGGKSCPI